jgi:transcription elongation factor Elf1
MNCPACNHPHSPHSVQDGDKITCQHCGQMFVVFVDLVPQYTTRLLIRPAPPNRD